MYLPFMSQLQRLQNTAARLITFTPKFDHISPVLFKLHWLPVKYRIQYTTGLLTFKGIHFRMPQYLINLLSIKENNKYSLRSASNGLILEDPTCRLESHSETDRSKHLPQSWNRLPRENVCQDVFLSCVLKSMLQCSHEAISFLGPPRRLSYYPFAISAVLLITI